MSNFYFLVLLAAIAVLCLGIQVYLFSKRRIKSPHDVVALASTGDKVAKVYVYLFVLAGIVFAGLVLKQIF
ncbi:MAG: hypothetical protein Q8L49_01835 [Burkholderiaceae bacterium]|nr:hypothetical protein [Burkholderiaceae bacterium]